LSVTGSVTRVSFAAAATIGAAQRGQRHPGAGRHPNVVAPGELEAVGDAAGSAATRVDGGGDADHLHAGPAQEHGQGARVIGVAAEVGIEMDPHHTSSPQMPRAPAVIDVEHARRSGCLTRTSKDRREHAVDVARGKAAQGSPAPESTLEVS